LALPPDATIADILHTLAKPEDVLCDILSRMYEARKLSGSRIAYVRIGIGGAGKMPCYRILHHAENGEPDSDEAIFNAYWYGNHPLENPTSSLNNASWSSRALSMAEIEGLLAAIRGKSRK